VIKDKRFLTGLGAGLIIGAVLLQLMNFAEAGRTPAPLSDKLYSQEEADVLVRQELDQAAQHEADANNPIADVPGEQEPADEQAAGDEEPSDSQPVDEIDAEIDADEQSYEITIRYRMTSEDAAEAALEAGLIDDKDVLLQELIRRNLTYRLQIGTFTFTSRPTVAELVDVLTSRPK